MWAAKQIRGRLVGPNEGEGGDVYGIGKEENKRGVHFAESEFGDGKK